MNDTKLVKALGFAALVPLIIFLNSGALAYPLKWAWNYIIPSLFHLRKIGALESFCLIWVSGILIKGAPVSSE